MAILKSTVIGKNGKEPDWKKGNEIYTQALNEAIATGVINLREVQKQLQNQVNNN